MKIKPVILILIVFFTISCRNNNEHHFIKQNDLLNKYSVQIPEKWNIEKGGNDYWSTMFFSDIEKSISDALIYDIAWDSTEVYLKKHFKKEMDSIFKTVDIYPFGQKVDSLNEFKLYKFDVKGFDSLNQTDFVQSHHYMINSNKKGHLVFSVRRHKSEFTRKDSILTKKIIESIKWN